MRQDKINSLFSELATELTKSFSESAKQFTEVAEKTIPKLEKEFEKFSKNLKDNLREQEKSEESEELKYFVTKHGVFCLSTDGTREWMIHEDESVIGKEVRLYINPITELAYDSKLDFYHHQPVWVYREFGEVEVAFAYINKNLELEMDHDMTICYPHSNREYFIINKSQVKPITQEQLRVMPFIWEMFEGFE